jgi:hypothetical protein
MHHNGNWKEGTHASSMKATETSKAEGAAPHSMQRHLSVCMFELEERMGTQWTKSKCVHGNGEIS